MLNKELIRKIIIGTFVSIPFLSSLISTIHLIGLFNLGNQEWMSMVLAVSFELGSIASLLILTILDKVNKSMVMSIFIILVLFQILGNIYFSFDYLNQHLKIDPNWLGSFQELVSYFVAGDTTLMKLMVSCLVSVPIPLISLLFLKSVVDYLKFDDTPVEKNKNVSEIEIEKNIYEDGNNDIEKHDVKLPYLEIISNDGENNTKELINVPISSSTVYNK